jgi:putative mRNA 3-end processing factor
MGAYLAQADSAAVLRHRLGADITLQAQAYGETVTIGGARVSLHPAGHVLGSSQVRIEHGGAVWVISGDYFVSGAGDADNPTCAPFEPVRCDCFVTESTFGLPIYRWRPQREVLGEIDRWWAANAAAGRPSLLLAYAFGKAQHVLAGVDASIGPIAVHGAVQGINRAYAEAGIALPSTTRLVDVADRSLLARALVIAPPAVLGSPWTRRLGAFGDGFASGWMQLRGARRRRGVDRGFVLSDHADWPGLLQAIAATGAPRVIVTHGEEAVMVRWLRQQGIDASSLRTAFGSDGDDADATTELSLETT